MSIYLWFLHLTTKELRLAEGHRSMCLLVKMNFFRSRAGQAIHVLRGDGNLETGNQSRLTSCVTYVNSNIASTLAGQYNADPSQTKYSTAHFAHGKVSCII